eukprot:Polyplicarium_translucidae@DN416_c0_g1_i1.p1
MDRRADTKLPRRTAYSASHGDAGGMNPGPCAASTSVGRSRYVSHPDVASPDGTPVSYRTRSSDGWCRSKRNAQSPPPWHRGEEATTAESSSHTASVKSAKQDSRPPAPISPAVPPGPPGPDCARHPEVSPLSAREILWPVFNCCVAPGGTDEHELQFPSP